MLPLISHRTMQFWWWTCEHGKRVATDPTEISSKQTVHVKHDSWSPTFTLSRLSVDSLLAGCMFGASLALICSASLIQASSLLRRIGLRFVMCGFCPFKNAWQWKKCFWCHINNQNPHFLTDMKMWNNGLIRAPCVFISAVW
jgi:hypothetical protein